VAQKTRIDGAVDNGEAQPRDEKILELFPDEFGVRLFDFHGSAPAHAGAGARAAKGDLGRPGQKEKVDNPDRVGIFDRQLTGKRRDKDLKQRAQSPEYRCHREKSRSLAALGMTISR